MCIFFAAHLFCIRFWGPYVRLITWFVAAWLRSRKATFPGPPGWPVIGNLLDLRSTQPALRHPGKAFRQWSKQYESNLISLQIPGASLLMLNSIKDVQELLVKRSAIYSDRPRAVMLNEMMGGDWLLPFMQYNDRFRTTRKLFHQLVTTTEITRPNEIRAVRRLLQRLLTASDDHDKQVRLMTGDFILSSAYGITPKSVDEPYIVRSNKLVILVSETNQRDSYIVDVFPFLRWIPSWLPGAGFKRTAIKSRRDFEDSRMLPFQYVQEQMAKGISKPSLASQFLESVDQNTTPDYERKVSEVRSALGNVYLGAADTTNAVVWSFVLTMALHPEVQQKAQAALDAELCGRLPTFSDLGTIPYVDAVVNEVFRWNPVTPLGVPHVARQDDYYQGRLISKGTMVFGNIWALLRDEAVYGADTDKFIPERFLTKEGQINTSIDMDLAFGWGRRVCPGKDLAREVLWLTAVSILSTFDICNAVDANGQPVSAHNIDDKYTQRPVSMPPTFKCTFKPRSAAAIALIQEDIDES